MASRTVVTLSIPNGGTDSPALALVNIRRLSIFAPATLTGTVTLQAGTNEAGAGALTVQSPPGTDISLAAAKCTVLLAAPFPSIIIHSGSAEAAQRDFTVVLEVGE